MVGGRWDDVDLFLGRYRDAGGASVLLHDFETSGGLWGFGDRVIVVLDIDCDHARLRHLVTLINPILRTLGDACHLAEALGDEWIQRLCRSLGRARDRLWGDFGEDLLAGLSFDAELRNLARTPVEVKL